jgi:hypothetical protein
VGTHRVGELALGRITNRFRTTIGGDCLPSGFFTLSAGEHVTCVVTNTLVPPQPPLKPPSACYELTVRPRTLTTGAPVLVLARVHLGRRTIPGVRVLARGPGVAAVRTTGRRGLAAFVLRLSRPGILRVAIQTAFDCPKQPPKQIGILGTTTPPVTG